MVGGGVGSPGPGTYDPAFPLPFCLTQRTVVVLSSSHRFSKVWALSFSQSLMFPLIVCPAKAPRFAGLHFAAHQDMILWRGVMIQPHVKWITSVEFQRKVQGTSAIWKACATGEFQEKLSKPLIGSPRLDLN